MLVAIILAGIFFVLAYMGIRSARNSLLKIMVDEGKALIASLTLSTNNAIQAGLLLESISEDNFLEIAQNAEQSLHGRTDPEMYRQFRDSHNLLSVDILDDSLMVVGSDRWAGGFGPEYPPEVAAEIHDIQVMGGGYRSVTIYGDSLRPQIQYFIYAFAPGGNLIVMSATAEYLEAITRQIGIGYLIQNISGQAGIDYILLQSREGIIFASRQVQPVPTIASDLFLDSLMIVDTIGWRIHEFEDRDILEIAQRFESVEYPAGIYRIGLKLDEYNEIKKGYNTQIITIAIILFLLTLLVVAVVSINQNYFILDQSYRRMRSMTETIFDRFAGAVLAYDNDDKIIALNKAFTDLFGITGEKIGRNLSEIKDALPFDLPMRIKPGSRANVFEQKIIDTSGEKRIVLLGASSLPQEAGGGVVVLINDITEQKQLEEDSRRRERLSEMGDMAAGVAHEIRNPLNSIAIAAQRLKGEFEPKNDYSDYNQLAQTILDEASRLNQILSRFLELARSQAKEQQIVDLREPISRAVGALKDEAGKSNIEIEYTEHEDVKVKGNLEKLQQVFINLLKNSIQAMPGGGKIKIKVDASENEKIKITVTDTGPGFPPDALSKVFQPYYTTKSDGSGLGLALAYKTINDFGGSITADNNPDCGARATIKLPKAKI